MAALAVSDEHPAFTDTQILEPKPSTSLRRKPPSTIASTIARSLQRRSAPNTAITSPGSSTRGN
jgi:hypothetical protein